VPSFGDAPIHVKEYLQMDFFFKSKKVISYHRLCFPIARTASTVIVGILVVNYAGMMKSTAYGV